MFFHVLSCSFIFFHFLSFSFIFSSCFFHFAPFHFISCSFFLSFSNIFFHVLSFSFSFSFSFAFIFLSFSFSFILFFFVGCSKFDFFGINFVTISLDSSHVKNQFLCPSRGVDKNEDARLRPIRLRTIWLRPAGRNRIGRSRNWPKSKLIGRSRTDGVCSVSFSLSFFFFCFVLLFFTFFLFLLISLFILFLCCCCFRPQNLNWTRNPEPCTPFPMDPSAGPPLRWTPLRRTTLRRTTLRRTTFHRTTFHWITFHRITQNFALFFPPPATIFILFSLSWGPFVEFCWCFWRPEPWNVHVWSSRAVVWNPGGPSVSTLATQLRQS